MELEFHLKRHYMTLVFFFGYNSIVQKLSFKLKLDF